VGRHHVAEKAMKAFLAYHDVPFRKTHNLEELGQQCVAVDVTLAAVADQAAPLTEYAWKFRYPGEPHEPDRAEAEEAAAASLRAPCQKAPMKLYKRFLR
jgi:HEPN domain-containing protein